MLVNDNAPHESRVKFISYSGKWPCLCSGILVLNIDGKTVSFGSKGPFGHKLPDGSEPDHEKFWSSGGRCPMPPENISTGEWKVDVSILPDGLKQYAAEIDAVMNTNVEHGCCGGCR